MWQVRQVGPTTVRYISSSRLDAVQPGDGLSMTKLSSCEARGKVVPPTLAPYIFSTTRLIDGIGLVARTIRTFKCLNRVCWSALKFFGGVARLLSWSTVGSSKLV